MKKTWPLLLLLLLFIIPSAQALSVMITPSSKTFTYGGPGTRYAMVFNIGSDRDQDLQVVKEGYLADYIEIEQEVITVANGKASFRVTLEMPPALEAGQYQGFVGVREIKPPPDIFKRNAAIVTTGSVLAPIKIIVPCSGKCARLSLSANNAEVGEPIIFEAKLTNNGKRIERASGYIKVYTNETITLPLTEAQNIPTYKAATLYARLNTTGFKANEYSATAFVDFDGNNVSKTTIFKLGAFEIKITNIYAENNFVNSIANVVISMKNMWNKPVSDIHGEIVIRNSGNKVVLDTTTPAIPTLSPFSSEQVKTPWNTFNLSAGNYTADATIYYGNKSVHESRQITLVESAKKKFISVWEVIVLSLLIALIILLMAVIKKKKKRRAGYQQN